MAAQNARDGPAWAPLTRGGTGFHLDELAEAYATDLLPQPEIDHIISALTPLPEDEDKAAAEPKAVHSQA